MADIEINFEGTDAKELFRSGHHAYIMKDYVNAAAALGRATQLMAQEHGDGHDSLGEIYLMYAKSLLEVSREESGPLGDAIPQESSDDSSDEDQPETETDKQTNDEGKEEKKEENNVENDKKVSENKEKESEVKEVNKEKETEEKVEMDKEKESEEKKEDNKEDECKEKNENDVNERQEAASSSTDVNGATNGAEVSTDDNTDTADKEEPSDLQLAWEVLEVAKNIFTARGDAGRELLSQTLIALGEVGMESENFMDAVKDIQAGLEIQEDIYEKTSRRLAETQYTLGVAYSTTSNIDEAIKFFDKSISTLNERINLLKEKDDESAKKEITEMEELIPEIKEKINDVKTLKDEEAAALLKCMKPPTESGEANTATSSTKDVHDITHLVKRKRKIEENSEEAEVQVAKKPTP